ncbi:MAG: hypothetical protein HN842_00190 [Gammaproteobacteria bacterium]|jgi:hypothetical protein|nr:hypothetical protein [Gammaproteobacteria bacterium]
MEYGGSNNAMSEIALALAMGFFSLMILTMVSMQVKSGAAGQEAAKPAWKIAAVMVDPVKEDAAASSVIEPEKEDQFLIYADGRYYDRDLSVLDPAQWTAHNGRVILGVSPSLSISETLSVRSRIDHQALVVTTLNQQWMSALKLRSIQ